MEAFQQNLGCMGDEEIQTVQKSQNKSIDVHGKDKPRTTISYGALQNKNACIWLYFLQFVKSRDMNNFPFFFLIISGSRLVFICPSVSFVACQGLIAL